MVSVPMLFYFFFSSRRRHTRYWRHWSSDVCSSDLNSGEYPIVATSRVLNEGVNVPEANVAVILSGSGSVREHVQRLGRILRKSGDKEAHLYEVKIGRASCRERLNS